MCVLFLENCQQTICMHGYYASHVDRSLRVENLGDKYVEYFPRGLENKHACKWSLYIFLGIICMSVFLESCQKSIWMHGYNEGKPIFLLIVPVLNNKYSLYCYTQYIYTIT